MLSAYAAMGMGVSASRFFAEVGHEKSEADPPPVGTFMDAFNNIGNRSFCINHVNTCLMAYYAGLGVPKWLLALGVFALGLTVVPGGAILGLERYKQATLNIGYQRCNHAVNGLVGQSTRS